MLNLKKSILLWGKGKVFSSDDVFKNTNTLVTKREVEEAIVELVVEKKVVHLLDNLFTVPVYSELIDEYSYPPVDEFIEAIVRNKNIKLVPTGALAENYLGISTQVPNIYTFATDGLTMYLKYFGQDIFIDHDDRVNEEMTTKFNALILMDGAVEK